MLALHVYVGGGRLVHRVTGWTLRDLDPERTACGMQDPDGWTVLRGPWPSTVKRCRHCWPGPVVDLLDTPYRPPGLGRVKLLGEQKARHHAKLATWRLAELLAAPERDDTWPERVRVEHNLAFALAMRVLHHAAEADKRMKGGGECLYGDYKELSGVLEVSKRVVYRNLNQPAAGGAR